MVYIENKSNIIGVIDGYRIEDGSVTISVLFKQVRRLLEKQMLFLLSKHFELEYNGRRITRRSLNLKVLPSILQWQSYDLKVEAVYPDYIPVREKPYFTHYRDQFITSFVWGKQFEMEFDFRVLPDDTPDYNADHILISPTQHEVHLVFFESHSTKMTVWIDAQMTTRALKILHFSSKSGYRDTRGWKNILSMDIYDGLNDTTRGAMAMYNHFYVKIGNDTGANVLKANLNGLTAIQHPDRQLFRKDEKVQVSLLKAPFAVSGVVRNVAFYNTRDR